MGNCCMRENGFGLNVKSGIHRVYRSKHVFRPSRSPGTCQRRSINDGGIFEENLKVVGII